MITFLELAKWIIRNRKGKAFEGYSMAKVCEELVDCSENGLMLCVTDPEGYVVGVVCGTKDASKKQFFIHDILTTKDWVIKKMLEHFNSNYEGYSIAGVKKTGKLRLFNNTRELAERI